MQHWGEGMGAQCSAGGVGARVSNAAIGRGWMHSAVVVVVGVCMLRSVGDVGAAVGDTCMVQYWGGGV